MQTIQLEGIELRPDKYFDITVEAEAVTTHCESSSEAGESQVTEAWEERDLEEFEIVKLVYWTDSEDTRLTAYRLRHLATMIRATILRGDPKDLHLSLPYGCQSYDCQSLTPFFILIND